MTTAGTLPELQETTPLEALIARRRTGEEPFHANGQPLDVRLLSFWQWACSEICGNALRGLIAEYLVAHALESVDTCRVEWDACDVRTAGGLKVEVKSSGYIQSWKQHRLSAISFDIAPKRGWDAATNILGDTVQRAADVYVFALHAHQVKATADPLDVTQWLFFVVPTAVLDGRHARQKRIGLESLRRLAGAPVAFAELRAAVAAFEVSRPCRG